MSAEGETPNQPGWSVSRERSENGTTVFRDEQGEPLAALAVTRGDLTRLENGLRALPESDATTSLLDRLASLHADLDESAE